MEGKAKIGIIRWEEGKVEKGLLQLEELAGPRESGRERGRREALARLATEVTSI